MNKKEILMICLIICFIFSISAVSAADVDVNTTDDTILTVQIDDAVSISNDLSSYSLPENNSIVRGENDVGSFSELQELINNDTTGTISLDKNYTFDSSSDTGLVQGIVISKDIVIEGNGFTIDALSSARIFNITSGSAVKLIGINFVNGGSASVTNGGSIYNNAQGLIIDRCAFDGSYAVKDGGAIYVNGDSCTVANSTFTNNIAGDDGGALYWNGAKGTIYNITCENNKGISSGTSTSKGGSICFTGSNSVIDKSTFKVSSATFNGGALFVTGDNVNITNCDFSNCTSDNSTYTGSSNASDDLPYGGAMYILGSNALVDTCTFDDCSAIYGGAIYVLGNSATINNSTFATNDATKDGGAIYIDGIDCNVDNSTFSDNTVGDDGGAIYWKGAQGSIYNITCTNNKGISSGTSTSKGGSICLIGDDITVDKSTFTDSSATFNGGALFITGNDVNITNCDFSSCTSDNSSYTGSSNASDDLPYGGAMYIIGNNTLVDTCTFDDCTAWYGGAIYVSGNGVIINNSGFANGESIEDAGAIYIDGDDCKVYNSIFTDNTAGDDGGAIYWEGDDGIIDGCAFDNNIGTSTGNPADPSTSKGGTLSVIGNNVDISNSNFTGGVTKNRGNANTGGAIFITGDYTNIDGCNFNDCRAEGSDGGVIYILGNHIDISNSTFSNSTARAGGAIYIQGVGTFIGGSNFTDTYAKSGSNYNSNNLGGAIYIQGVDTIITHSNFENSHAYNGGMVYMAGDNGVVMHSSLNNGHATNDGGAIYATGSNCTIFESNLTNNYADGNAGGIYWNGGANSHDNTVNGCILANNTAYARSNTNTKGGGAIYWSEGGKDGSVLNSQFINNSVQSNVKADGGAMLWDRSNGALIDNCTFDGNYITTSDTGNVWVQGGALYLRVDDSSTIKNSVFKNSASDKEAGAVYIQSKTLSSSQIISVTNVSFINNTAKAIGQNSFGGGALQLKECNNVMLTNVSFINNTANNGGALAIYLTKGGIQLINCSFDGNNATDDGGSIWANKAFTITNTAISNSTASERGGGMYVSATMTNNNLTFINNTAKNGGGLYLDVAQNLANIVFINNTAEENGGGIYINDKTITVSNANMTGNKAFSGSAIYTIRPLTLRNSYLIENQANSSLNTSYLHYDSSDGSIDLLFEGWDRYINAVYLTGTNKLTVQNVTYWGVDGVMNTGSSSYSNGPTPTPEVRQNFTFRVYDNDGNLLAEGYDITDGEGMIHLNVADIVPSLSPDQYDQIYIEAELTNDDYYVNVEFTTRGPCEINASATNTTYHSNTTISVNLSSGATGNVSVYLNDTFVCNITLGDDSKGSINIDTILEGEFIPAGNHTLTVVYNGNFKFIPCNTTTILEIRKITPTLIINATEDSYCVDVNVTVIDEELNTSIPTGTVTLEIDGRIATIKLVNGTGSTRFAGIPIGNYTLNGEYSGDNNYNSVTNSTDANITTKQQTVVYIDVDVRDIYWVNETVHVNVTVFPNATGNVTLYLNGVPHNLTLVNSTASFDATDLIGGPNHILVTYNGDKDYAPSWGEASFYVIKFNATVEINATNITVGDKEIINFTLPENATGILNVTINGTRHYVEIINGTATLPVYELPVGVYNVTAYFNGDRYYYNATNSTLFNVSKATANITISVDNVTYGNDAVIVVTVPEGVTGNITLTINETTVVFGPENITDGKATFIVENLPAGNYTINATYNGDGSHAVSTAKANFTVYKADVELEIEVHDIPYGNVEDIIVTVRAKGNAQGNVTITVAGNTTTIVLGEEKTWVLKATQTYEDIQDYTGTATWHIYNLAVGTYPVTATYNGNENFNVLTKDASFIVYQINTTLDVDVDDILVWDKESINVTLAKNTTGNVIININGENHTVPITNGTAQLNLTNLTVGHKVVWVFYDGDKNYTANRTMKEFDVGQRNPLVNVTALNVTVDQDGKITINIPANATGYVILSGNFTKQPIYVDKFTKGVAEITVDDLAVGNYSVHIKYYGDALDNYTVAENDTSFKVDKINTTLSIDVKDIKYSESANITVTVLPGVEGTITIKLNDAAGRNITLPIVDGKVNWIVPDLAAGDYTVNAVYNGNDECNINDTESKDFTVSRATPVITIDEAFTDANTSAKVIVHINDTATGTMNITVNGKSYEANINNGVAEFTVDVLPAGDYDITANYYALTDSNYTVADRNFVDGLHVAKVADYPMNISALDIAVGENTTITVNVPDDATGKVIIELNGTNYTATISQGVAVLNNVSTLDAGIYNVTAYFGDDKYANKTVSTRFTVSKADSPIKVDVVDLYVGDTAYINVTVPDDDTGSVTIEINGKSYGPESVTDGVARFVVPDVTYGNKTVAVTYSGTDNYVSNFTTANFTVDKRIPGIVVSTDGPISVGDNITISVELPANATGYVNVNVNGTNYTINLTEGNSVVVPNLGNGTWNVTATYLGDDQYWPNDNVTSFVVSKVDSTVEISVESIDYGDKANITVTVKPDATGYITIKINETRNITLPIAEGKVNWIVEGLAADNYTVYANYSGDDKYNGNKTNRTFEVRQISPNVEIVRVDSTAGENATIIVRVDHRVTENVTINVNGTDYSMAVDEHGIAVFTTDVLENGTFTVVASYAGDKNFTANSTEYTFTTNRTSDYVMNITASDIYVGNNTNITVHVPTDATGKVIIELNGTNYTATISQGVAVLDNVSTLEEGVYNVTAYFGNDKYANKTASTRFVVSKVDSPIKVDVENLYVDDTAYINVTVPDDNSGNVTIEINGKVYGPESVTGGVARFVVPNVAYGNKTVAVTYSGSDKYVSNFTTANFTVSKRTPVVNVTNITIIEGKDAVINISGPSDRNATLVVTVDGVDYAVNMTGGNANLTVKGLSVDNYTVSVTYIENDKYVEGTASGWVNVTAKGTSAINITVEDVYRVGQDIVITLTPVNSTGNISVTINGKKYNVTGNNVTIKNGLPNGTYEIVAVLDEDDNYYGSTSNATFNVVKNNITITVNDTTVPANIVVGTPVNFTANLNESVTGDVIFTINGANYTVHITDSDVATYEYTPVNNDTITVVATFMGNDKYNSNVSAQKQFNVNRIPTDINVTVKTPVTYGEDAVITVELNETINTTVKLIVDGKEYDVAIINGKGGFNATGLNSGDHKVNVTYVGDDKYAGSKDSINFTVNNATLVPEVTAFNVTVEENTTFVINVTDDFKGNVSIKVGDKVLYNGSVETLIYADKLPAGDKNATVVFYGDSNYDVLTKDVEFTVSRVAPSINMTIADVTYPNNATAVINVSNAANGTVKVTVKIKGTNKTKVFNGTVSNGVARVNLTGLAGGDYEATADFISGDDYNGNATADDEFTVLPNNSLITITKDRNGTYKVGEDVEIKFTTTNSTGLLTIFINGNQYKNPLSPNPGNHEICIEGLAEGNYTITAVLEGDQNYTGYTTSTTIKVVKNNVTITVNDTTVPATIYVGSPVNFTANLNESVTGDVVFTINGANYTVHITNATAATFEYTPVNNDTITVVATFMGNDKYNSNVSAPKQFNVNRIPTDINVTVKTPVTYGEDAVITVELNETINTTAKLIVDGKEYDVALINGKGVLNASGLNSGDHKVNVTYVGDDKYAGSKNATSFTVDNATLVPEVTAFNVTTEENTTFVINVTDDFKGNVSIKVGDKVLYNGSVKTLTLADKLPAGDKIATVVFYGDSNYDKVTLNDVKFTVSTVVPEITVEIDDVTYPDKAIAYINVGNDANGTVNVTVDGKVFKGTVSNGVATVELTNLSAGSKVANAEFFSTDDYNGNATASAKFTVNKANSTIVIGVDKVYVYNDTIIINLTTTGSDGAVNVTINGKDYNVTNNQILIAALAAGDYTIIANLAANENYTDATNSTTFKVEKAGTNVTIAVDSVYKVGDDIVINVTTVNATDLTVTINGNNYTVDEDNKVVIPGGLEADEYIVTAVIAGNENYTGSKDNKTFMVVKRDSFIYVDATNTTVDGEVIINVTVPDNATGYVVVNVNGTNYSINLTAGEDRVAITAVEEGLYNVTVTYLGDDKFLPSNNTTTFKVDKLPSFINVTVSDGGIIANGTDVDIFIDGPSDITGNVTVIVWDKVRNVNKTYTVYVNGGEGILHLKAPAIGNYTVNATYLENRKYLESKNFTVFEIYDTEKVLEIVSDDVSVFDNEIVYVHVDGDQTGNNLTVIITNADGEVIRNESVIVYYYTSVFNFSSAKWKLPLLDAGQYNVTAIYIEHAGPRTFIHKGNNSFLVYKVASEIKIKEIQNITVGQNVTIELELTPGATGNISVFVNGIEHKTTADNLTIIIPNLGADVYVVDAFYHGDKNYNASNDTSSFRVDKNNVPLSIDIANIGDVVQINVTVGNNATGQILLDIEDNHYYANITDGVAQFNITGLKAGEYNVTATYIENDKYYGNTTNSSFTISKYKPEFTINGTDIDFGKTEVITIETKDIITSLVTVEVNGENYTTFIKDGKGNLTITDLAAGDYNITLYFPASEKYESATAKNNFTVSQIAPDIRIVVENITYGEVETIIVYVNAEGNVTIEVGGQKFEEEPIVNGMVIVDVSGLDANNYTVNATYNGNTNFTAISAEANFTVQKADPIISIDVENIIYGNVEYIVVHVNAAGNVTISINGTGINETISLESGHHIIRLMASRWDVPKYDGTASLDVYNLAVGTYNVAVTYNGNENYNTATAADDFVVFKDKTNVSVEYVPSMEFGESQVINITVNNTNATGEITINVDGKNYTRNLTDGKANFTIEGLSPGNHTVVVVYEGDRNLTGNWSSLNIEVNKVTPVITVNATNTTVGDKTLIEVSAPDDATRPVLVDVDGVGYYVNLTDGKGSIEVPISKEGTYNVTARYLGDDKYTDARANNTFIATKATSSVNVTVENITVGDKAVIEVSVPQDATGNVTVTVDGKDYNVSVSGGKGVLVVPDLKAGNYTVDVKYLGDDKYDESTNATKFTVSKAETDEIKVIDQNNGTITIIVGDNATGNVTVKVGNETYNATVIDGVATVDLVNNTPGTYDVEVIYSGDDNHNPATGNGSVTIPKLDTPISVEVNETNVGDAAEIVVNVPENATGNVTIEIDGVKYTEEIKDGKATFHVENLTDGNKTIAVEYVGDNNYTGNHTTANFTVSKVTPVIKLNATVDGDDIIINITAPEDATNPVLVDVDGVGYYVNITDGKGQLVIPDVTGGNHDVTAKYPGDDKYYESDDVTASVKVTDVPSSVSVKVNNITYGEDAVVEVTVPSDATGNVTVTIDGKNYTANVSGGKAVVVVPGLEAGNHTVDVYYSGDDKYQPSSNVTDLEVSKAKVDDIKVIDQNNGTITVVVPDNATGTVEVKVGNETYNATVENGVAVITLNNTAPGTYDIEVVYSGDENHTGASKDATVTTPKLDTPISVEVSDINVGDTAKIVVNVPDDATGDVTIEIDGVKYTEPIKDGKATFNIDNLAAGNKTIAVDYAGDDKYVGNHTAAKITVSKCESEVSATITDSNVGENVTVTVTVPSDATGQVLVDIDGVGYYVNVTDGKGTVEIPRIPSGVYNVAVTYTGDDKYLSSSNTTSFKVSKVESFVIPKAQDIYVGDDEEITISVPEDATGTVTLVIDGEEYDFDLDENKLSASEDSGNSYAVAVSYGKGRLTISGLPRGDYIVSARYNGDDKYLPSTNTTTFKVLKKSSKMDVTDLGNGTVVVDLPDDATGTVAIKVGNNIYNATVVDGKAVVDLTNETPGTHDIEVTYSGDDKHNPEVEDSKATIPKYDTPISVEVGDIGVGDTAVITVTLPDDATGTVTIEINGETYTADVKDGKAVFNVAGLEAGNKTVAVKYDGDDNYVLNSTTGQFTVSKVNSTIEASGKNITVGTDEVITVNVPNDATGRVLVEIDGVGYYGDIINGKAKIIIPELPSGEYTVTVNYEGDDKYLPSSTTASFTVTKGKTPISAIGDEITEGEDANVVVNLPEDATGTVTINVGGKEYTTDVVDGKAVFTVPDLSKGNYNVEVSYSGDKKYESNSTTTDIIVHAGSNGPGNVKHAAVDLTKHATGNPILVLLLVILAIGSTQLRRFKE